MTPLALSILEETYDVLESPLFTLALSSGLSGALDLFSRRELGGGVFGGGGAAPDQPGGDKKRAAPPLANVVTALRQRAGEFFRDDDARGSKGGGGGGSVFGGNVYVEAINRQEDTAELVRAVLDTF